MDVAAHMESIMPETKKKKIMVQLWSFILQAMEREFTSLHLKRDSYLNDLLSREIEKLDSEVTFRNSDAVRARFNERKLSNRVKLTIELDVALVARIDKVLIDKNIPRDSFLNRVLFFLLAKKPLLDTLGLKCQSRSEAIANPLDGARGFLVNPFFHIRICNDGRFYTLACFPDGPLPPNGPNLFALNTAIYEQDWKLMNNSAEGFLAELTASTGNGVPTSNTKKPASSMAEVFAQRRLGG